MFAPETGEFVCVTITEPLNYSNTDMTATETMFCRPNSEAYARESCIVIVRGISNADNTSTESVLFLSPGNEPQPVAPPTTSHVIQGMSEKEVHYTILDCLYVGLALLLFGIGIVSCCVGLWRMRKKDRLAATRRAVENAGDNGVGGVQEARQSEGCSEGSRRTGDVEAYWEEIPLPAYPARTSRLR